MSLTLNAVIPWTRNLPASWTSGRLRNVASIQNSNVDKKSYEDGIPVRLCNYTDVYYNDYITDDMSLMEATASLAEIERFTLHKDDVIITKDSETAEDIAVPSCVKESLTNVVCGYHLTVIRSFPQKMIGRYLLRALQADGISEQFHIAATGVTRVGLNLLGIKDAVVPIPPLSTQKHIADFLDIRTSQIDQIISRKQKLIEKLEELRASLINRAVTKGLNPDVPMKSPTGDVTGDIAQQFSRSPTHWRIGKVKNAGNVCVGRQRTPKHQKGNHIKPYLRVANVLDGWIDYSDVLSMNFEPEEQEKFHLRNGDVLLNEGQSLALVGRPAVYRGPENMYCFQNTLVRFRAYENTDFEFAYFVFKNWMETGFFQLFANKTTNIAHLGGDRFANMPFPFLPLQEQRSIASTLSEQTSTFNKSRDSILEQIVQLQDYRQSLITAAVTGLIDVTAPKTQQSTDAQIGLFISE